MWTHTLKDTSSCADSFYALPNCFCKRNCSSSVKTQGNKFALWWPFLNGEEGLVSAFNTKWGSTSSSQSIPLRTMRPKQLPVLTPLIQFLHLNEKLDQGGGVGSKGIRSETMSSRHYFRGLFHWTGIISPPPLTVSLLIFLQHAGLLFYSRNKIGWCELKRTIFRILTTHPDNISVVIIFISGILNWK